MTRITADEAGTIARMLRVGTEEVIAHLGRQRIVSRGGKVPLCRVWGWLDKDVVLKADEDGAVDGQNGPQEVRGPERGRSGLVAIIGRPGGPMEGWAFFFDEGKGDPGKGVDRLCMVQIAGEGRPRLRWLFRGPGEDQFLMTPLRGGQPEVGKLAWATPIGWVRQNG